MEKTKTASKSTIIIRTIFTTFFGIAAIFVPAGTLKWTEAWLFILQPSQPLPRPSGRYFGRDKEILEQRQRTKQRP